MIYTPISRRSLTSRHRKAYSGDLERGHVATGQGEFQFRDPVTHC